jgi:beta-galactosidase
MDCNWIELAHGWKFLRDEVPDARLQAFDDSGWETVSIPHCFNSADSFIPEKLFYRGPGWYRVELPELPKKKHVELSALGAFSVTHVWLNGTFLGKFMGGYTGFRVDLTPHLKKKKNVLALRVTNQHNTDVLPGNIHLDYDLYGGIYREIGLNVTDPMRLPENGIIVTTPEVTSELGRLHVNVRVSNDRTRSAKARVIVQVRDPGGAKVSESEEEVQIGPGIDRLVNVGIDPVKNPSLWSPEKPNVYTLTVRLAEGDKVLQKRDVACGFRWFRFDAAKGFFLNDEPMKLNGVNRHQDYPGIGNALPASFQSLDVEMLKEIGVNFVRCSHYPMHPAFLDACDRLGVLVFEEIASWQFIGGQQFAANAVQAMEEMISRDRHHPSIILWGLLNEGRSLGLFTKLNETAQRMDPYRATIYAENHPEGGKEIGAVDVPNVLGLNYKVPHLDELRELLDGLCLMNSEHSNANTAERITWEGVGGTDWHDDQLWQTDKILSDLDEFAAREWMAGSALWCMHDYGTEYEVSRPIQRSGCFDAWRSPKLSAHAIRARWSETALTHILGHWNWDGSEGESKQIGVASNANAVELFLNDTSLGVKTPDEAARKGFYLWDVPYAAGTLRAVGNHGSNLDQTVDELRTSGDPAKLEVEVLHTELPANGTDITIVTATVVDSNGVWCPQAQINVGFKLSADNASPSGASPSGAALFGLYGKPEIGTWAGRGRIALRTAIEPGSITIKATADGLTDGAVTLEATAV